MKKKKHKNKKKKNKLNVDTIDSNSRRFLETHTIFGRELRKERLFGKLIWNLDSNQSIFD